MTVNGVVKAHLVLESETNGQEAMGRWEQSEKAACCAAKLQRTGYGLGGKELGG